MRRHSFIAAAMFATATPAMAQVQTETAPPQSVFDGDYITIGGGAIYGPSYEGSDDQVVSAIPIAQGSLGGIDFSPRPGGLAFDLIPDGKDPKFGFSLGPVATYTRNRRSDIKDPVVRAAGKLKSAVDVGVNAGVTAYKLLNAYDSLTLSSDVRWNVNSASKGMIVTPSLSYSTPLSRAAVVSVGVSAKHVDGDYARYYYSVTPAQSAASGLPVFAARGGWVNVGVNALAGYDLDGNLLNGGFALFALGRYSKLLNDAKRTPYTSIRGDDMQWTIGGGLAYTF